MDDSCAVCAETLEWVAYGACGHREVCSTCVARLRFICNDRRCCICKTESNVVFVTKALGDYTRMISDFAVLPSELREGRVGLYWYHEGMQAFFDDLDHYKMIKAMCRLSCSVCDKMDEHSNDASKRRGRFRNIDQLKGHLFHQHNLRMCSLCLQGRKVFVCEQKLYTRAQLNQHINTGDSEVDGTESERGGFMGHPLCEFCRTPFYGDNELYSHMSTEHYTCHICQRQHPGQYEYYKNYDDLEIHFRREHFLCEDEACLGKKFVVFQSEAEIKRHNAMEHGGRMSRSKRNAVLQIPTSFRYQRSNEQDNRRGRGRGRTFHRDYSEDQLSMAIEASYEMANPDGTFHDPSSFRTQIVSDHGETSDIDPIIQPFESFSTTDSEPSRYLQALSQNSRNAPIVESSFPPLPMAPASSQQKPKHEPEVLPRNTMATHLRRQTNRNVTLPNSAQAWPAASRAPVLPATGPIHTWPTESGAAGLSSSSGHTKAKTDNGPAPFSYSSLAQAQPAAVHEPSPAGFLSSRKMGSTSRIIHSTSAPNLADSSSFDLSDSGFPPVSATQVRKLPTSGQSKPKVEDVHTANKSLVERIRSALDFDEAKYSAFKDISGEYRQGLMDAETYVGYVNQFGLSHLVIELARLCPDAEKQRALVETYDATLRNNGPQENGWSKDSSRMKDGNGSKKGKGKCLDAEDNSSNNNLVDSVIDTVQKLQSSYKPSEEEVVEVLSKDGYRAAKGKSKVEVNKPQAEMSSLSQPSAKLKGENDYGSVGVGSNQNLGDAGGKSKQRKKTSKFHRVRLGDGSVAALLDLKYSDPDPDPDVTEAASDASKNLSEGLPVRGVWQKGGGQRLLAMTARDSKK